MRSSRAVIEEGDTELITLTPESEETFYAEAMDAEVTFDREPGGRSTGLVARVNGLVLRARRID